MANTIPGGRYLVKGKLVNANGEPIVEEVVLIEPVPVAEPEQPKPLTAAQKRAAAKLAAAKEEEGN
jgi:hypothetical protein